MPSSHGRDASSNALRAAYDSIHVRLSPSHAERLNVQIMSNFRAMAGYGVSNLILGYQAMGEELDVRPLLERAMADGKKVALPAVKAGKISYTMVDSPSDLGSAAYARGTAKGAGIDGYDLTHSLCLVPGLVFDAEGYRIGYGAGYLDNFLATYPGLKVGVVRGFNVSSNPLPREPHDRAVDVLVSESAIWSCRRS